MHVQQKAPDSKNAERWTTRQVMYTALLLIGTAIILGIGLFKHELQDTAFVLLGVLLMEFGIFKLAQRLIPDQRRLLPERRKYLALRSLADQFIPLVRQLNTAALLVKSNDTSESRQAFEEVRRNMQALVEGMAAVAGKTQSDLAAEARRARQAEPAGVAG